MGVASLVGESHSSAKVKITFRRLKPYDVRVPKVEMGLGLMYASAAR